MPAASLLDIVADLLDPSASNPWLVKNVDMVVRILGALYVVTFGVLVWSFTRRATPRDDGSKKRAEEQAKAITDLTASLESERKRRQSLEAEVEKIKQQLDEQKQRFEKQIDDLLARNRNVIRDASEAAAKAHEDLKSSTTASQKALEAAKAAHAEELKALTAAAESATKELADVKLEIQAERVKVKQAQADRERLEKEIGKERERAAKLEGQCDRAQKEIDSLSQQMLKMVNESHTSEAASSEAAANSTFIEDLEKSIDALEAAEIATGTPKSLIADMHIQSEEIDSASAALAALERALGGDSDDEKALEAARAAAVAEHDLDHAPPPRVPLPDPSSVPGIILTDAKKDRKKMLTRRVSFGSASAPAAAGLGGADEEAEAEAAEAAEEKDAQRTSGEGEQAGSNVVPFKTFGVKADINKRSRGRRGGGAHGMEDENLCAFPFVDEQRALFCVFDGHAGRDCAVDAKSYFPREFAAALEGHLGDKDAGTLLTTAFRTTDEQLKKHEDMGCTATVVYVWCVGTERFLQCANVGDSTAFLSRNGTAVPLSFDHKATAQAEKQRIRAMGIEVTDTQGRISGLAIARALGDHFLKSQNTGIIGEPTVSPAFLLTAADTLFVLASDGLWDVMSGQEACDLVRDIADPDEAASALITTAIGKGTTDNITVIVVRL